MSGTSSEEELPERLPPPIVGKVGHHSIELSWDQDYDEESSTNETKRRQYCVQEEEDGKQRGFGNVYNGYSRKFVLRGLEPGSTYRYRVRVTTSKGSSPWSSVVTVITTKIPISGANIHNAVLNWEVEKVKRMLNDSEDVLIDVPDGFGMSPLMVASQKGYSSIVETLIEYGANVNFANSSGKTSMMLACFGGHLGIAQKLKEYGADLTLADIGGATALHCAIDGDKLDCATWLLENEEVQVDQVDDSGWSPLLRLANVGGSAEVAQGLVEKGAQVNKKDKSGTTALMAAAVSGHLELCKVLVDSGADVSMANELGRTAIECAESFNRQEVCKYLKSVLPRTQGISNQDMKN